LVLADDLDPSKIQQSERRKDLLVVKHTETVLTFDALFDKLLWHCSKEEIPTAIELAVDSN